MIENVKTSPIKLIGRIVIGILILLIIVTLAMTFLLTDKSSSPNIFGYNLYLMKGTSMEPTIPNKALVISKSGPLDNDPVGSIALCNFIDKDLTTVVRVVGIDNNDGKTTYIVKNDSKDSQAVQISSDKVIGEATHIAPTLGVILTFATSQAGIIVLIILPCALILVYQLVRILRKVDESKPEEESDETFDDADEEYPEEDIMSLSESGTFGEPEFEEEENVPKVSVDKNGKAEYVKNAPTADAEALDKVLQPTAGPAFTEIPGKAFEFKADEDDTNFHSPIKPVSTQPKHEAETNDVFIAPRKKKPSSNATLEKLMQMLDKEEENRHE